MPGRILLYPRLARCGVRTLHIDKYNRRAKKINLLLCVDLDADFNKVPKRFFKKKFPQFEFNKWVIEETHEYAATFKLNIAFYGARGDKGIRKLKMTGI